jgi:hypothetical protein
MQNSKGFLHDSAVFQLQFTQARDVFFGNQQQMLGRLRIDIPKRQNAFTLRDNFSGDFSRNNLAKDAIGHSAHCIKLELFKKGR